MYQRHFGFHAPPFEVTADPRFLYESACHREALASLKYGILQRRGFIALVGEVGTGKSTLVRALLEEIDASTKTILITHTSIDREELLRMILQDIHLDDRGMSRIGMLRALNDFVIEEAKARRPPPVLIVDEAHNLSMDVLEEIRLLTNLESSQGKMLQVILSGQPELEKTLDAESLRQLRQRIAIHCRLRPLDETETREYIAHRLALAGRPRQQVFSRRALGEVWRASGGVPRMINHLCEHSLLSAYAAGKTSVDGTLVREAAHDLRLDRAPPGTQDASTSPTAAPEAPGGAPTRPGRWRRFLAASLVVLAATLVGYFAWQGRRAALGDSAAALKAKALLAATFGSWLSIGDGEPDATRSPGERLAPPDAIERVAPEYPASARGEGVEGSVPVWLLVEDTGRVARATVDRSTSADARLVEAALAAAARWRFAPAPDGADSVPAWTLVRFEFSATPEPLAAVTVEDGPAETQIAAVAGTDTPRVEPSAARQLQQGRYEPPVLVQQIPPRLPLSTSATEDAARVRVWALVDELGRVSKASPDAGGWPPELVDSAMAAVSEWTFRPARRDGRRLRAWVPVDFRFAREPLVGTGQP